MKSVIIFLTILASTSAPAQQSGFQDSLLNRMIGQWILKGTIAGQQTTHDVNVAWVLAHQYVQLHEVSREEDSTGRAAYEAIVYIGWDQQSNQYACLWLDITAGGGLSAQAIGHAARNGDTIPFLFRAADSSLFHTTFIYNRAAGTWEWRMDDERNGNIQPFARLTLARSE